MNIRSYRPQDIEHLVDLTISTFGPFYEDYFHRLMGTTVFQHQHGNWRDDYRAQVPQLHDPANGKYVAIAEADGATIGYVAWNINHERQHGEVDILAVASEHRGHGAGRRLCEHAFAAMRDRGVRVVEIGTGGDPFHAAARSLYEDIGCTPLPAMTYFKEL